MNVFFDVQGTLISCGNARPHVREAFLDITGMGHHVYLWSSAGGGYARAAAEALGVGDIISGWCSKSEALVSVDFAVDDSPGVITGDGYLIPAFTGNPTDAELPRVVKEIRRLTS